MASMDLVGTIVDWVMFVVIWLVQLFVYPGFRRIEKFRFTSWHARYLKVMGVVVGPLMIAQLGNAIWNAFSVQEWVSSETHYLCLVVLTWIVTFRFVVPIHDGLQDRGKEPELIKQLILANWPRTILWSVIVFV